MSGTVRSWIHYLDIRASPETQLEHRQVAEDVLTIFEQEMPDVYEAAFT
jgi:thymidylate synthase (FAD)